MNNNKKELKNVSTKNDDSHKSEKIKISNDNYNNSQNSQQQQQQQQLINNYDNSSVVKESRNFLFHWCDFRGRWRSEIIQHMRCHHTREKPYR